VRGQARRPVLQQRVDGGGVRCLVGGDLGGLFQDVA
jgi:hypothetical protein